MAYHFEFEPAHRILLLVMEGEVGDEELIRANEDLKMQADRLGPSAGLCDLSGVTAFNVASRTTYNAALKPSPFPDETPRFIVAPKDHLFGMARMYQTLADRPEGKLHVVRSMEEALAALGVKDARFEKLGTIEKP